MNELPKISRLGERSILIEFEPEISKNLLLKLLDYKKKIENYYNKVKVELINTYNSILISYESTIEDVYSDFSALKRLYLEANIGKNRSFKRFEIPVCYDEEFGLDLKLLCTEKGLSKSELIALHSTPNYLIYFTGFLPGFLYLGGLNDQLKFPRKDSPRRTIEKGSVGVAENQTGIYPQNSPGGWQIIGKTPIKLFDKNLKVPSPFSAGDEVIVSSSTELSDGAMLRPWIEAVDNPAMRQSDDSSSEDKKERGVRGL